MAEGIGPNYAYNRAIWFETRNFATGCALEKHARSAHHGEVLKTCPACKEIAAKQRQAIAETLASANGNKR